MTLVELLEKALMKHVHQVRRLLSRRKRLPWINDTLYYARQGWVKSRLTILELFLIPILGTVFIIRQVAYRRPKTGLLLLDKLLMEIIYVRDSSMCVRSEITAHGGLVSSINQLIDQLYVRVCVSLDPLLRYVSCTSFPCLQPNKIRYKTK